MRARRGPGEGQVRAWRVHSLALEGQAKVGGLRALAALQSEATATVSNASKTSRPGLARRASCFGLHPSVLRLTLSDSGSNETRRPPSRSSSTPSCRQTLHSAGSCFWIRCSVRRPSPPCPSPADSPRSGGCSNWRLGHSSHRSAPFARRGAGTYPLSQPRGVARGIAERLCQVPAGAVHHCVDR